MGANEGVGGGGQSRNGHECVKKRGEAREAAEREAREQEMESSVNGVRSARAASGA